MLVLSASCPAVPPARSYARREPENSALHLVVREHLETFLTTVREERGKDLPRYVEQELRRYLRCGILAHGFLRPEALRNELLSPRPRRRRAAASIRFDPPPRPAGRDRLSSSYPLPQNLNQVHATAAARVDLDLRVSAFDLELQQVSPTPSCDLLVDPFDGLARALREHW